MPENGDRPRGVEHRRLKESVRAALFDHARHPVRIDRFTILQRLGAGGMGIVYAAYDDELDRKVALKVLRHDRDDEGTRARLRREAQAIARLSHPNVVSVFEVGEHDGRVFMTTEFVRGQSLRSWMDSAHSWRDVVGVFVQAGRGLAAAHASGMVHRDFKPDNVMIGDDGRVRVLDFGVVSFGGERPTVRSGLSPIDDDGPLTATGARPGTVRYMAPEQLHGQFTDARSDQFAFCVALWEALFRTHPFAEDDPDKLLDAMARRPVPPTSHRIPSRIRAALLRGLSEDPNNRFDSMDALLAALSPRRTTKTALLMGAGLIALTSVGSFAYASDECEAGAQGIGAAWSSARREAVRAAVAQRGSEVSLQGWQRVERTLDEHARRWRDAYTAACTTQDAGTSLEQRLCLERELDAFSEIVDSLVTAEAEIDAVGTRLQDPTGCLDADVVNQRMVTDIQRRVPLPPAARDGLFSDFEDDDKSRFGAGWSISTDRIAGGQSTASLAVESPGADGDGHALVVRGSVWSAGMPRWSGVMLWPGSLPMQPANLTSKSRIRFWAEATPGRYAVLLFAQHRGLEPAITRVDLSESWHEHEIPLEQFGIETHDVTGIFIGAIDEATTFELRLDDVRLD